MFVICNGMPRSASTWSFNVILGLLRHCCPGEPWHAGYNQNLVQFSKAAGEDVRHIVMKSHTLTPLGRKLLRVGAVKVIYTFRDLADAAVSGLQTFSSGGATFDDFLTSFDEALEVLAFHRATGMALELSYNDVVEQPAAMVARIGAYLWPDGVSAEVVGRVVEETSLPAAERIVEQVNRMEARDLVAASHSRFDPKTLFHPNHLNGGASGRGRQVLSGAQLQALEGLCAKYGFLDLTLNSCAGHGVSDKLKA